MNSSDFDPQRRGQSSQPNFRRFAAPFPDETEEFMAHMRRLVELARDYRAELMAAGVKVDNRIAAIESGLDELSKREQQLDFATDIMLNAAADQADAATAAFKATDAVVQAAYEINPYDSKIQEFKEFVDQWRKEMPKENPLDG